MIEETEDALKLVIKKYRGKIFPLVYYLIGKDSDKAYEITAASFAETFMAINSLDDENAVMSELVSQAIGQSKNAETMPSSKEPPFKNVPPERRKMLQIMSEALSALAFNEKAMLLMRDQVHLSYKVIASILGVSESVAKSQINLARSQIRKKVEEVLL